MVRRDAAAGAAALALGAAALHEAQKLPFGTIHNPGQGFFPWWTAAVIVPLALLLLFQALRLHSSSGREGSGGRIAKVAALLLALAAYAFLLEPVGYMLSTFLLVLFMLRATDPQRWPLALVFAAITAAGSYAVFAVWLSVPLPRGWLLG